MEPYYKLEIMITMMVHSKPMYYDSIFPCVGGPFNIDIPFKFNEIFSKNVLSFVSIERAPEEIIISLFLKKM